MARLKQVFTSRTTGANPLPAQHQRSHQRWPLRQLTYLGFLLIAPVFSNTATADRVAEPKQNGAANTANMDTPSLDLLLFLADWSDGEQWLDPLALERVMQQQTSPQGSISSARDKPLTESQQAGDEDHENP